MLKIREQQMKVLADYSMQQFVTQATLQLGNIQPSHLGDLDESQLREFVIDMTEKAEALGIETEEEVLTYISYAVRLGPDFDTQYEWASVLSDPDLDGEEKIELLEEATPNDLPGF